MDEQLIKMLTYLRLRGLIENWDRYLAMARTQNFSHVRLLQYIIEEEYKFKKDNARRLRIARAKIPVKYVIETFPFKRQPKLNRNKLLSLYDSTDYM